MIYEHSGVGVQKTKKSKTFQFFFWKKSKPRNVATFFCQTMSCENALENILSSPREHAPVHVGELGICRFDFRPTRPVCPTPASRIPKKIIVHAILYRNIIIVTTCRREVYFQQEQRCFIKYTVCHNYDSASIALHVYTYLNMNNELL